MCIDPVSLTALGTGVASLFGGSAAATGIAGASTLASVSAATAAGISTAAVPAAVGIFGTGVTATEAIIGGASVLGAGASIASAQGQENAARASAQAARLAGYSAENLKRDEARRAMANQLAALSARGISLSSGTPLSLLADSARNSELNALTTRANAGNEAGGYDYKASAAAGAVPFTVAGHLLDGASKLSQLGKI